MVNVYSSPKILDFGINKSAYDLISETLSTWSSKPPYEIKKGLSEEKFKEKFEPILEAIKSGYGSIQESATISVQAILPRSDTLALVSFLPGSSHLQQSLRYTLPQVKVGGDAQSVIFIPRELYGKSNDILKSFEKSIDLYFELNKNLKVLPTRKPEEEARYHLPWNLGTFISSNINLAHLSYMLRLTEEYSCTPTFREFALQLLSKLYEKDSYLGKLVEKVSDEINIGKYYPTPYPFVSSRLALKYDKEFEKNGKYEVKYLGHDFSYLKKYSKDELEDIVKTGIKEGKFDDLVCRVSFAVKHSGVARHEIVRHRTVFQTSTSLYDAAERGEIIITQPIRNLPDALYNEYLSHIEDQFSLYDELKYSNASIGVLPHNIAFTTVLELDGYNIFNYRAFLGNRCCELAQFEVQMLANQMSKIVSNLLREEGLDILTNITHANCFKIRKCPELKERAEKCSIFQAKSFEKSLF